MELRHLRYFVAVAETENVSRAALKLHVSQPALSRQIRDLESELGLNLFERSAKSVRLTEAGRVFLTEARAALQRVEEAVKAARAAATGRATELHVGYAPTLSARVLPPALRAFQRDMPKVRVKLHDLSTEEMVTGLREGSLHLALSVRPVRASMRDLRFEELLREPLLLAVAPNHPFARRKSVSLDAAAREPLIAYNQKDYPDYKELLDSTFASAAHKPQIAEEHDGVSSLISAVETGCGVAIVPQSFSCTSGLRVKLLPLLPAPKPLTIGIVLRKEAPDPTAEFLMKCLAEAAAKLE